MSPVGVKKTSVKLYTHIYLFFVGCMLDNKLLTAETRLLKRISGHRQPFMIRKEGLSFPYIFVNAPREFSKGQSDKKSAKSSQSKRAKFVRG